MEIVVTHDMTDFDALAATVAAEKLHPGATVVLGRGLGIEVRDYLALHRDRFATALPDDVDLSAVRHLIVVDVRRKSRLGDFVALLGRPGVRVTVYDHHPAADDDIVGEGVVVDLVGSTTTLLVERMQERGIPVDEMEATLFALGIHADTGSLTYAGTTARDARALGFLLEHGASVPVLRRYLAPALSVQQRALLADLLGALQVERLGHLHVAFVQRDLPKAVSGFAEVISVLAELSGHSAVFAVFGIGKTRVQVVARSRSPLIDAGARVTEIGGGGHSGAASGMLKRGDARAVLDELRRVVFAHPPAARRVADLMSSPVHTVSPSVPFAEVARSLASSGHTGVPVLRDGRLVGIVSRSDVERAERAGRLGLPVSSSMSQNVKSIDVEETPERALELMTEHDVGRLPVLRQGHLVGIVTRSDLRRVLYGETARAS